MNLQGDGHQTQCSEGQVSLYRYITEGGGKDPMIVHSYRGLTLTSVAVVGKVLILKDVLLEAGIPHINRGLQEGGCMCADCVDAIYATQEAMAQWLCSC